jgi:hypothetical protein
MRMASLKMPNGRKGLVPSATSPGDLLYQAWDPVERSTRFPLVYQAFVLRRRNSTDDEFSNMVANEAFGLFNSASWDSGQYLPRSLAAHVFFVGECFIMETLPDFDGNEKRDHRIFMIY